MKVGICTPTRAGGSPVTEYLTSLGESVPILKDAGWEVEAFPEVGCPYISHARATMLRKALTAGCDAVVFIDDDLSWQPDALLRLLEVKEPVVSGTYRFKKDDVEYMGQHLQWPDGKIAAKMQDGQALVEMFSIPGGFLKITREAVQQFMRAYPELLYGDPIAPSVDLFNHGADDYVWWGEDYAFARRWRAKCGRIWLVPDIEVNHHATDGAVFVGNYDGYLRQTKEG